MIRIDAVWMATEPLDMRAGPETALARVVQVFGAAHPHHAYLFANQRANRMKVLVHDGVSVWLAARRLNTGKFACCERRFAIIHERVCVAQLGHPLIHKLGALGQTSYP
ncbi:IS66 family insertion sequence element accessory protein TnpB [Limnohabitans sp. 2KL-17]|uniref:IS66 family insertion sequence element accessory protein TnpB n=1 Tax=Limnohabitans sp. 2KL-17 TaxID=1100704 RepID=UPI001304E6FB|nr:IS66 family insertion sequence element accessory protein TnpB [Limnohabitans sp. 2KL-17]